ncbi:cell adhesion molecule CEACAM5-like [Centroberyx affinis]|uniref:cell adhesion molecule CEACAM5-like n=1 Tax=Centroberyx affinis TaxID=166261 RepID=UPI003A5C0088
MTVENTALSSYQLQEWGRQEPPDWRYTVVRSTNRSSSVRLSCSSSGSSLSFLWFNGSSEVSASEGVQLGDGGSTLTIVSVTRYDEGLFMCRVSNPVSNSTSAPVSLSISFGPENTNLTLSPSKEYYEEGSNIILSCSADSRPAALFHWALNGSLLSDTGPELRLNNIQMRQSGNYSCQAHNSKTLRYQTSQPSLVTVLGNNVSNVVVTPNTTDLSEFSSSVSLSCSSSGSSLSFLWLNGSSEVSASEGVQLGDGGSTLTIVSVTRYDEGPFTCRVSNPVSNAKSAPVSLSISFGPENTNLILSPSKEYYEEGSNIILSCSADSRPAALFHWALNGSLLSDTGPELRLNNIHMRQSGNYSCQSHNSKTLRYQTSQPSLVTVLERISGASITGSTNRPVEGNSVNLTCEAAGSVPTREWRKDGSPLNNDITLHDEGRLLSFSALKRTDRGEYSCKVSNPISSEEAKYNMVVNSPTAACDCSAAVGRAAGITAACFVVVAVLTGTTVYVVMRKKRINTSDPPPQTETSEHVYENSEVHENRKKEKGKSAFPSLPLKEK